MTLKYSDLLSECDSIKTAFGYSETSDALLFIEMYLDEYVNTPIYSQFRALMQEGVALQ